MTFFVDMGVAADEMVIMVQALMEGMNRIAAVIREAAQRTLDLPNAREIELAEPRSDWPC